MAKKSKTQTVNVDAVKREVSKIAKEYDSKPQGNNFSPGGFGEAAPGSARRESPLEQEMGTSRYRQMIHDHNDKNKHILDRLPFTFPRKKMARSHRTVVLQCPKCAFLMAGTEFTVGIICPGCKKYVNPENPDAEEMGFDPAVQIGFQGTLSDKLAAKDTKKSSS